MTRQGRVRTAGAVVAAATLLLGVVHAQTPPPPGEKKSSYAPVDIKETFAAIMSRMSAAKDGVMKRQMDLLAQRYDLANRGAADAKMFRGKAIQDGVRVRLPAGVTWDQLGAMEPDQMYADPLPKCLRLSLSYVVLMMTLCVYLFVCFSSLPH